ncbi:MAG: HisA/HisF-related TIM barrel protein, partial [Pseudomonadota bacterium]
LWCPVPPGKKPECGFTLSLQLLCRQRCGVKRVMFGLLHNNGNYVLSRNFRQQVVGDLDWVLNNYNLLNVSCGVDEIIVLDVGSNRNSEEFAEHIRVISNSCFVPLAAGGGITNQETAALFMASGADKLVLNTALFSDPDLVSGLVKKYGSQCIVGSFDYIRKGDVYQIYCPSSDAAEVPSVSEHIESVRRLGAGEILCQSVEKDGTGMGLDLEFADRFLGEVSLPTIMLGGVGRAEHIFQGLKHECVDAVCTANLLNFIGDAFEHSRSQLVSGGILLPQFSTVELEALRGYFETG